MKRTTKSLRPPLHRITPAHSFSSSSSEADCLDAVSRRRVDLADA